MKKNNNKWRGLIYAFGCALLFMLFSACTEAVVEDMLIDASLPSATSIITALELNDLDNNKLTGATFNIVYNEAETTGELSAAIEISGLTNSCTQLPCSSAEENIGRLTLRENADVFTITAGSTSIDIPDQTGARSSTVSLASPLTVTNVVDNSEIDYEIIIYYQGTLVSSLVSADNIGGLISATFAARSLSVTLSGEDITLSDVTNVVSGSGSIDNGAQLPAGYSVTKSNGTAYTFTDPDGPDFAAYGPAALSEALSIAERAMDGSVVNDNEVTYKLLLHLEPLLKLAETDIELSDSDDGDGINISSTAYSLNYATQEISITVTNACSVPPCENPGDVLGLIRISEQASAIFSIDNVSGGRFIEEATGVEFNIPDQTGAATQTDISLGTFDITRTGDGVNLTYTIVADYQGMPVRNIIEAVGINELITATFTEQTFMISKTTDADQLTLSGVQNIVSGSGSIDKGTRLPADYFVTKSDGTAYTFADPDGEGIGAYGATALSEVLSIAERAMDGSVVTNNEVTFTVDLELTAAPVFDGSYLSITPTSAEAMNAEVSVTTSGTSGTITIIKLTNACAIPPCSGAGETIGTLNITETANVFTLAATTPSPLDIPDQKDAHTRQDVTLGNIIVTNTINAAVITYTVIAHYAGMAVADVLSKIPNTEAALVAIYNNNKLTVTFELDNKNIALSDVTNAGSGDVGGYVLSSFVLPYKYEAVAANGSKYALVTVAGTETYGPTAQAALTIAEKASVGGSIIADNKIDFAVTLELAALLSLQSTELSLSLNNDPNNINTLVNITADVDNDAAQISLTGLTNSCTLPPCLSAGIDIGTLTLTANSAAFTLADGAASVDFTIPDQAGAASSTAQLGSVTLMRTGDKTQITYNVIATYSGTPAASIVTALGADGLADGVEVELAGQVSTSATWDAATAQLSITNIVNVPDSGDTDNPYTGSVRITPHNLPAGYYIKSYTFDDPSAATATSFSQADALVVAEGDASTQSVTDNNQATYELVIQFTASPTVVFSLEELVVSVQDTLSSNINVDASALALDLTTTPPQVTITAAAGVANLNEAEHTLGTGTLTLSAAAGAGFTVNTTGLDNTFNDTTGTETVTYDQNTFTVTSGSATLTYALKLVLATAYNLQIAATPDDLIVTPQQTGISHALPRCAAAQFSVFTIAADGTTSNVLSDAAVTINDYYDTATAANNTNTTLSVFTDAGEHLEDFAVTLTVQACNFFAGSGTDSDPYQIDSDKRLELLSRLLNASSTYNTYKDKVYELTSDVELGIVAAPWAESSTHPNANTNGFTPIGKTIGARNLSVVEQDNGFSGTFDCKHYSINNLYISNTANNISGHFNALFAAVTNNAVIKNCELNNAKVTAYSIAGALIGTIGTNLYDAETIRITNNTIVAADIYATTKGNAGGISGLFCNGTVSGNTVTNSSIRAAYTINDGFSIKDNAGGITGFQYEATSIHNNSVTNVTILATKNNAGGIVGESWGTFSDNSVEAAYIKSDRWAGGIAGEMDRGAVNSNNTVSNTIITTVSSGTGGSVGSTGDVDDVVVSNTIAAVVLSGHTDIGGIAGWAEYATFTSNTFSNSSITGNRNLGGIAGYLRAATVTYNHVVDVSITTVLDGAGGISGEQSFDSTNQHNIVENTDIRAESEAGGITGIMYWDSVINNNIVMGGSVTANRNAGGVVGSMLSVGGSIIDAVFIATTVTSSAGNAGGFIGTSLTGMISNSIFIGAVNVVSSGITGGGIAHNDGTSGTAVSSITHSYVAATAAGTANTVYGLAPAAGIVLTDSYYDNELNVGATDSANGKNTSELQTPTAAGAAGEVYESWDDTIWNFGSSSQYPVLKNQLLTEAEQCAAINAQLGTNIDCTY